MVGETQTTGGADGISHPGDAVELPAVLPDLLPPPEGDSREFERLYFDPEKWDAELVQRLRPDASDPVETQRGRVEGQGSAALFLSDFHMADGSAGGDDFLESHLHADEEFGGLHVGFFPPGESRAKLFASVVTYALQRIAARGATNAHLDIVLNGDVINFLDLKGRGGTYVWRSHALFFRALAALRDQASIYWLRGNHDYVVPSGPWQAGEFYVNPTLRTLAEHGDFWDKENWPPGPTNKGSSVVIELSSAFETHPYVTKQGVIKYLMSGLDNLRPWCNAAIEGFLDRRSKYSEVGGMAAILARLKYIGAADDSAAYEGAKQRRKGDYRDWLMIQGHTHVPVAIPGIYYNLGTWITTLVVKKGQESQADAFPFLIVYTDAKGERLEEYYVVQRDQAGVTPRAVLQSHESVNELREVFGYKKMKP
jgi:hypothetical protein